MHYGSREWFVRTPDEARRERRRRKYVEVGGLTLIEPANEEEVAYLWDHMRPEEKDEALEQGGDRAAHRKAVFGAERTIAIYHADALLAVATVFELPRGGHGLSLERTAAALEKGHSFAWLRGYAALGRWIASEYPDGVYTLTPVDLPRALDVYRHAGAEVVGRQTVGKREYFVLKVNG